MLDRTAPLLERLAGATRTEFPDALAKAPRRANFVRVRGKTVIGSSVNRLEIYRLRGQTIERQMMVYSPGLKMLYGSDAFQKSEGDYFYPQTVAEVQTAVASEHLVVERFFMMHMGPTPCSDLLSVHGGLIPSK